MNTEKYLELYYEWFKNKEYWFKKCPIFDKYIADKYSICFLDIDNFNNEDIKTQIGAIIAFDQIPRHFARIYPEKNIDCYKYSIIASEISLSLMTHVLDYYNNVFFDKYTLIKAHEWCFILLPFRHIKCNEKINTIIKFCIEKHNNESTRNSDKNIYKNFIKNTIEDVYKYNTNTQLINQIQDNINEENTHDMWVKFNNILQNIPSSPIEKLNDNNIIKKIKLINDENIIVSLSGGVDSCVSLFILKNLLPNNNIVALHINYNNSENSIFEMEFVKKYCNILGVKLYIRSINEIYRNECHLQGLRNLYESITKDIRFDAYRQVSSLINNNKKTYVVLGHNMDDCFENILTNISSKCNYDNLAGITKMAHISNINFWRPILDISKQDIIQFALKHNIPFLKNSTPTWSNRGKIRDIILPSMLDINPDIVSSFFSLKKYLQSSQNIIDKYVINNIISKFHLENDNIMKATFKLEELIDISSIWKQIFLNDKLKYILDNKFISFKSVSEFSNFIKRFKTKFDKIQINVIYKFKLRYNIEAKLYKCKNNDLCLTLHKNITHINENDF